MDTEKTRERRRALERRLLLSAATRAVLVAVGDIDVGYDDWEYLVDSLVEIHERLNDRKPPGGTPEG